MTPAALLAALAGSAARRARLVLALALVLGAAGAVVALRLHPTAATSTLVSSSSPEYAATQRFYAKFGEEPVQVLVRGDLQQLLLSSDIDRLVGLEGCLSGNVPPSALAREGGPRGPCAQLGKARSIKVVLGPGTFINEAAIEIDEALAAQNRQARQQAHAAERAVLQAALARGLGSAQARALAERARKINIARFQESLAVLALQYGLTAQPSLDNANFVSSLVFDSSKPAGTPKQRFAYLFPARDAALISVRMRSGLSERQRTRTIALIRRAVCGAAAPTTSPVSPRSSPISPTRYRARSSCCWRRSWWSSRSRSPCCSRGGGACCRWPSPCSPPRSPSARCR